MIRKTLRTCQLTVLFSLSVVLSFGQKKDSLLHKLDSLTVKAQQVGQKNNITDSSYTIKITPKYYVQLLMSDLKQEFTKPFHMSRKNWLQFGAYAAGLTALTFADEPIQVFANKLRLRNPGLARVSSFITNFGGPYEGYTLLGFEAYGLIFKSQKVKTTVLLGTQAYLTAGALESVIKYLSGRTRPSFYGETSEAEPRFLGPFSKTARDLNGNRVYSSFPSGHATVSFAVATVFAKEYHKAKIVPILAYSASTLIALSRLTENKHWFTDIVLGSTIGYLAGSNVVNNYHRFAQVKKKSSHLSFNLQYNYNHFEPGLVYNIK
jgi:membrane-associated phospholipid phosphatase